MDGVIFVADSQRERFEANLESLYNLEENLEDHGYNLDELPFVIQYNKRDLPNAVPIEELEEELNERKVPSFEASALTGEGVFETFKAVGKLVLANLANPKKG